MTLNLVKESEHFDKALKQYTERLKKYEDESKGMSALEKHVFLFLDKDKSFSPKTVASGLKLMHGRNANFKGFVIAMFNAIHSNKCPAIKAIFEKDKNGYARFLHLGTTRIWNPDGSINEERLQQFKNFVTEGQHESQKIVMETKLKEYLAVCLKTDPEVTKDGVGRNASSFFSFRKVQAFAAIGAWNEVFDRLACGYKNAEPYLTLEIAEEFFRDSPKAFLRAEYGLLPKQRITECSSEKN